MITLTLQFPFALDGDSENPVIIQPVSNADGNLSWGNVYNAVGKFTDLKNNQGRPSRRIAVLEASDNDNFSQAKVALSGTARVVVFREVSGEKALICALKAA